MLSCTSVEPGASVPTAVAPPSADGTGWVPAGGDQYCLVGPTRATGAIFAGDAAVRLEADQWAVAVSIRPGPDGLDLLNAIAAQCFNHEEACPSGQLAIVVDGAAVSVAAVQTAEFEGTLQISGSLSEAEAQAIARSLNAASLPA
ncbi:MAG: hypothetical protein Q7V88_17115 [Actinomycetota bacterium]|nr:hypothetical protein [Actinomycetota bacterium]